MSTNFLDSLNLFTPITLAEMDGVKLMDRTDTKFIFNISKLSEILNAAKTNYHILNINGNRISKYKTLYFDTDDFKLYHEHHRGKLNRYKVRHRTYVDTNIGYLEIKFKNNKSRTLKTRIKSTNIPDLKTGSAFQFLESTLPFSPLKLVPRININYSRITLVNKFSAERLTLDLFLEFEVNGDVKTHNNLVIAEVKQDSKISSPFVLLMHQKHIVQGSISKYCLAIASTFSQVKKNNFKQKLSNVNKTINS